MKVEELTDQWFIDNGYWIPKLQTHNTAFQYVVNEPTLKWVALMETCLRAIDPKKEIITIDIILDAINNGSSRNKRRHYHVNLSKEEKERRKAIRQAKGKDGRENNGNWKSK